jgi:hypothetical protein
LQRRSRTGTPGLHQGHVGALASPAENLKPIDFVARWRGQTRDLHELATDANGQTPLYQFPSGSSDITVEIRVTPDDLLQASLVFGGAPRTRRDRPDGELPARHDTE